MSTDSHLEDLTVKLISASQGRQRHQVSEICDELIFHLRHRPEDIPCVNAERLLETLRANRHFDAICKLSDKLISAGRKEHLIRRHLGQALIDSGAPTTGVTVLRPLLRATAQDDKEHLEALGLIGRGYKQIFIDNGKVTSSPNRKALARAIDFYGKGYAIQRPCNIWHGVNLAALLCLDDRHEEASAVAKELLDHLNAIPPEKRDAWTWATGAEASIVLGHWSEAEAWLGKYLKAPDVNAFAVGGTLRQFIEVWGLDKRRPEGQALVGVLRARLLELRDGHLQLSPNDLKESAALKETAFERILGDIGTQSYRWLQRGLSAARSVAQVREGLERGVGTGFVVRGGDFNPSLGDERLLLTNAHVVSEDRGDGGLSPDDASVAFQVGAAGDAAGNEHRIAELLWSSPKNRLDASLLRLEPAIPERTPMEIAKRLPALQANQKQRVYVIGHPGGRDLAFSLQDNALLDHEGPQGDEEVGSVPRRLHYRAPTEGGSSGSPVFDQKHWRLIGLHHAGGEFMPRLHNRSGTYPANEAIWIQSVVAGAKAAV